MKNKHIHSRTAFLVTGLLALTVLSAPLAHSADPAPMSATELWKAYQSDQDAADKAYKGKTIVVTGRVYFAGVNPISKTVYVSLKNDEGKDRIACSFPDSAKAAVSALTEDQKVTIKGVGDGPLFKTAVKLKDCELVGTK
jgi:hypothetical protein